MASEGPNGLRRWSFTDVHQLAELWPGAVFREIGHGPFSAMVVRRTLPTVVIEGLVATPHAVRRGEHEIAAEPRNDLLLHVVLDGRGTVRHAGTSLDVAAGDAFLLRPGRPFEFRCPVRTRTFRATVGEGLLPPALRDVWDPPLAALHRSTVVRAFRGLAWDLLADDSALSLPRASAAHLDAALVALEQGVLAEELARRPVRPDGNAALRDAVLAEIEARLTDPALSPTSLAEHFSIGLRTLHKLFEALPETAAGRIRRRRVEEAAAVLRIRDASAAELAGSLGFGSRDVFQRAFRQLQGMTPAEYRALRAGVAQTDVGPGDGTPTSAA